MVKKDSVRSSKMSDMSKKTKSRKLEHLKICIRENVEVGDTYFSNARFVHNCLPEISMDEIDTSIEFMGKTLKAPFMIAAMTGGVAKAGKINRDLASVAEKLGIGFGVGSQRAMLEDPTVASTYKVRDTAPKTLVFGNIGVAQLGHYNTLEIIKAMKDIGADAVCVHLNAAQEAAQTEGDLDFRNGLENISRLARLMPVIAKEVGNGVSREAALDLKKAGVKALDIGGFGGTSWVKVDSIRAKMKNVLNDWGIPTAASVMECHDLLPVIATGGIRDGVSAAKAIALGAQMCGVALPALRWYSKGGKPAVEKGFERMIREFRTAMFLTGSKTVAQLRSANIVVTGKLKEWAESRGINSEHYACRSLTR